MSDKPPGTVSPFDAIRLLKALLPPPPYEIEYDNAVGPNVDKSFWEWWEVAGIRLETRASAEAFLAVLESVR